MKVMVLVKASQESEAGQMPSTEELRAMGEFNDELIAAGIMLAGEGLHPTSRARRVRFDDGGRHRVTDGPFAETREILAGFNLIEAADAGEAMRIARQFPWAAYGSIEVREVEDLQAERVRLG